ncbi:MAG: lysoplasmalogenase [Bacteroidales bacterium]
MRWWLIAALLFSIAGDWMLKHRGGESLRFVYGIALFLAAHACFLFFSLQRGAIRRRFLWLLLAGYGIFFAWKLSPAIPNPLLFLTVLLYTAVSCFSLAAAAGLRLSAPARWLFAGGIACILFSDTLIALYEFLQAGQRLYKYWMMPAYYAAHILITAAIIENKFSKPVVEESASGYGLQRRRNIIE